MRYIRASKDITFIIFGFGVNDYETKEKRKVVVNNRDIKKIKLNSIFSVAMLIFIMALCLLAGLKRIYFSDFIPINGDFQNYNGFRRLLAGQVPFKDFYFYLGLGPLYINSFFVWIMGNNFTHSLFVTNAITALMFSIAVSTVFILNRLDKKLTLFFTFLLLAFGLGYNDILNVNDFFDKFDFLSYATPGVSIRMQRAFLPFAISFLALLVNKYNLHTKVKGQKVQYFIFGFITGACLAWSNDYGISVFLTLGYIFVLINLELNLTFIKKSILYLLGIVAGAGLIISLFTLGHLLNWVDYNILGVANDQYWYYLTDTKDKLLVLSDLPRGLELLCGFLVSIYLSYKVRKGNESLHVVLLLFVTISTLISGYAYSVSSMKEGQFTPFYLVFYVSVVSFFIKYFTRQIKLIYKSANLIKILTLIFIAVFLTSNIASTVKALNTERGVYVEELGGSLSSYGNSLKILSQYYVKDGDLFSTYSSALDVISGKFQPSGIDYIIHVLGDQYRTKYMDSFHSTKPKYVTTIREDYSFWEYWVKRENWYFYRELLSKYKPVAVTEYNVLWELTEQSQAINAEIKKTNIKQVSPNEWEIEVVTDPKITNAIADITFDYTSNWNENRWKGMGIRRIINITDGWNVEGGGGYNIPNNHDNYPIPVRITNGEGKVRITSYPENMTDLNISNVSVHQFFVDSLNYETIMNSMLTDKRVASFVNKLKVELADLTDTNWEKGINRDNRSLVLVKNSLNTFSKLKSSKKIVINNQDYEMKHVDVQSSQWIQIYLDKQVEGEVKSFELK